MTLNKLKISYSSFSTFFKLSETNCQSSTTALVVIYYPRPLAKITDQHDRAKTLSIMTLRIMTLRIMILSIMKLNIMTISIMTLSIIKLFTMTTRITI